MKKYRHLFFDLDRTLWDFNRNSRETLQELYEELGLEGRGVPGFDAFLVRYHAINDELWTSYRNGQINREVLSPLRFRLTLEAFGINDPGLPAWFAEEYLRRSALSDHTYPEAKEVLEYLRLSYTLHIITNGFTGVQFNKLRFSGLIHLFGVVLTSEEAGLSKPDPGIFHLAMQKADATPDDSVMIGDDYRIDILGARQAGMDQVWYNPEGLTAEEEPTFEIASLTELSILF